MGGGSATLNIFTHRLMIAVRLQMGWDVDWVFICSQLVNVMLGPYVFENDHNTRLERCTMCKMQHVSVE